MNDLLFVVSAFMLGGLHALEPGHGKTVVAAYLIGTKGRVRDAITLGGIVTFTHTFSIILLGVLTAVAANYFVPETVHEVLEVVSGLLIVAVGVWMINDRIIKPRASRRQAEGHEHGHARPHDHDHAHDHAHPHAGDHGDGHGNGHAHGPNGHHVHPHAEPVLVGAASAAAGAELAHSHGGLEHTHLLVAGREHHHHDGLGEAGHQHASSADGHHHHDHESTPGQAHAHAHPHAEQDHNHPHPHGGDAHGHAHPHGGLVHSHGGRAHSHALPPDTKPSLGSLITLGVSGGIVPCPAALALLLAAVAMGNLIGGISLVIVFSLGLATVLIAIGIILVKAASLVGRYFGNSLDEGGRITRYAGTVSALVVTLLGLGMTARAILEVAGVSLLPG